MSIQPVFTSNSDVMWGEGLVEDRQNRSHLGNLSRVSKCSFSLEVYLRAARTA